MGKTFQNHSNGEPEITKYGEKAFISSPFVHTCKTRTLFLTNIHICVTSGSYKVKELIDALNEYLTKRNIFCEKQYI